MTRQPVELPVIFDEHGTGLLNSILASIPFDYPPPSHELPPWRLGGLHLNSQWYRSVLLDSSSFITCLSELTWNAENASRRIIAGDRVGRDKQLEEERANPFVLGSLFSNLINNCDKMCVLQQSMEELEIVRRNNMGPNETLRLEQLLQDSLLVVGPQYELTYPVEYKDDLVDFHHWISSVIADGPRTDDDVILCSQTSSIARKTRQAIRKWHEFKEWVEFRIDPTSQLGKIQGCKNIKSRHYDLIATALCHHLPLVTADEGFHRSLVHQVPLLRRTPYVISHRSRSTTGT